MSTPSFSSFPPSFSSFPDLDPGPSTRPPNHQDDREEPRKRRKKESKEKKHRNDKHTKGEGERHKSRSERRKTDKDYGGFNDDELKAKEDSQMRNEVDHTEGRLNSPPLYFIDRKGDPLNVKYGGLHARSVPRYYLVGGGKSIIGLSPSWKVVHRGHKGVEIAVGGRRKMPGLTDSGSRHLLNAVPTRRLLAAPEGRYKYDEVDGFLRLPSSRPRKDDQSYRAITAPKNDVYSDDSTSSDDSDADSSGDDSDTTPETSLQATLRSLEQQLSANPSSVSTWISFLTHTLSTIPITSKNASKAQAEITLSMLSRALSAHPSNKTSKTLRLRYIKAGEEVWHESKLRAEWDDALKVGGVELWIEWLDWRIRRSEAGVDGSLEDAKRALSSLEDDEIGRLRILWRMAVGFRDAGYTERATALFQAQAELIYRISPDQASQPFDSQLDALEEFWESEAPRIGEASARGMPLWTSSDTTTPTRADSRKALEELAPEADPFRRWATFESVSDQAHQLPTRSFEEADDTDPYATILFSDIRPLLVHLRSQRAKLVFRIIWLAFLGLHVPGFLATLSPNPDESTDSRWVYSHLSSPAYLSSIFPSDSNNPAARITADAQAGVLIGREREYASVFGPVKSWGYGVLGPLEGMHDGKWRMWGPEDVAGVDGDLVREVFTQCRTQDDTEWDILHLAFEAACSLKGAVSLSKKLLATSQELLLHWAAHARLNRLRGRLDDARKVYLTVLSAARQNQTGEAQLWWDWAEMEWLAGQSDTALEVIVRSTGSQGSGGIAILRAKRHLDETSSQGPFTRWKDQENYAKLRALLELLTTSLHSALSVLDAYRGDYQAGEVAEESLTVASLTLLYNHAIVLRNPVPPVLLRERAEQAIERYPSNTVILGMFLEAEKGQGIWGRIRALLGDSAAEGSKGKDISRRVAEVWATRWEKGRWEAEQERTRGGLAAAVQDERTRGSTMWRLYMEFEIRAGQLERAKKLLFRAVGECSSCKELYLLAFRALRSVFSGRELSEWAETMAERGIRMRRGLDEVLEGWAEKEDKDGENSETGDEDEIEHDARELRRLMPY